MTVNPQPTISVNVDVTNPGEFYASCGLLELAGRLWLNAEGWFCAEEGRFNMMGCGPLPELMDSIKQVKIESSLGTNQLKRLATLLSVEKATLAKADREEKEYLQTAWRTERLYVSPPFRIWLDWWRDHEGKRTELKTWAAKQMVLGMVSAMVRAIQGDLALTQQANDTPFRFVQDDSLPFNFDSNLCTSGNSRDAGFSTDTLNLKAEYRPLLELLAFIGLQRFRPRAGAKQSQFTYCVWNVPLPLTVAGAASSGSVRLPGAVQYRFELFNRTKYMKAFLPAQPSQRSMANV